MNDNFVIQNSVVVSDEHRSYYVRPFIQAKNDLYVLIFIRVNNISKESC